MRGNAKPGTAGRARAALSTAVAVCAVALALPGAARAAEPVSDARVTAVERISVAAGGVQADDRSADASITPDGRRIVFSSWAKNLRPGNTAVGNMVYVRDQQTGQTTRHGSDAPLKPPVISADGGYVGYPVQWMNSELIRLYQVSTGSSIGQSCSAYNCELSLGANGLHLAYSIRFRPPEPNQRIDVVDWETNIRYTIDVIHNTEPSAPSLSDDGGHLAYQDGGTKDVFVWDRADGTPAGPIEGPSKAATLVQLSDDGSKVVYLSGSDTYVYDTASGTTRTVPNVKGVAIDPTGQYLLYAPHTTTGPALVLRDLRTDTDEIVSARPASAGIDAVSSGGRDVVFQSAADDIVPGDTNGKPDVFLRTFR
ncbi:TolB family protein [Streptomyces sp. NPDC003691]